MRQKIKAFFEKYKAYMLVDLLMYLVMIVGIAIGMLIVFWWD